MRNAKVSRGVLMALWLAKVSAIISKAKNIEWEHLLIGIHGLEIISFLARDKEMSSDDKDLLEADCLSVENILNSEYFQLFEKKQKIFFKEIDFSERCQKILNNANHSREGIIFCSHILAAILDESNTIKIESEKAYEEEMNEQDIPSLKYFLMKNLGKKFDDLNETKTN